MNLGNKQSFMKRAAITAAMVSAMATTQIQAEPTSFTFNLGTIQNVGLTERQAVSFGNVFGLQPLAVCGLPALATTNDWGTATYAITPTAAASPKAVIGAGCGDTAATDSTYGHYLVSGNPGSNITVSLISGGGEGFDFAPQGVYDNSATAGDGSVIAADTPTTLTLDGSGQGGLLVGGTVTLGVEGLEAGAALSGTFEIDVTY